MSSTETGKAQHEISVAGTEKTWDEYVEDFRRAGHETVDWIAAYIAQGRKYPVVPHVKPGALVDALPRTAPDKGESFNAMLRDFEDLVMPAVTHWNHPGFFAYFACTASTPAILGEMVSAALNTNGLHWKTSPAVAELEQVSLGWLRQWIGLPDEFFGIVYDTASVSSMHALVAAREFAEPEARENGSHGNLVVYASDQAHSSIEKGAIAIGLGQKNVRKVSCDAEFRMNPKELAKMIEADIAAGKKPICVVATIGTTSSTSVDPVDEIADICERHNLWLHVDSAYAGPCAILPEMKPFFKGFERAHSVVLNPHKWLLTNIDLSAFYTRRPDILRSAFSLVPEYLRSSDDPRAVHLMDYGVPLGHRFRSLKFWFVLRYFGREGVEKMLRTHIQWAKEFAAWVDGESRFERVAPVNFSVVCFRFKGSDDENRALLERVNQSDKFFLSSTALNGQIVLRIAIGNLGTTREDVAQCWETIKAAVR
jgi:aromatic-L-amino-acid/L-tryptophan decarboxylase